jgi:hypothetical protein
MKPKEFYKIMQEFVDEDKRWRALQVGGVIYEEVGRGMDFDYHKMIIDVIDLEERIVMAHDAETPFQHPLNQKKTSVSNFLTEKEFNALFNPLIKN